jgi:hypothetical protein
MYPIKEMMPHAKPVTTKQPHQPMGPLASTSKITPSSPLKMFKAIDKKFKKNDPSSPRTQKPAAQSKIRIGSPSIS